MEYIMGKKLLDMPVNMKIVKMISTINECKGKQIIYKKQPKKTLEKLTEKSKKVIDNTLKMVYIIPCIAAVVRQPDAGKYARVAQWWSTSLPRRGSRVRSPSRALFIFREAGI